MEENFIDSYNLVWELRNDQGKTWVEKHDNISLSDFEVIYGNNVHEIIELDLRLIVNEWIRYKRSVYS